MSLTAVVKIPVRNNGTIPHLDADGHINEQDLSTNTFSVTKNRHKRHDRNHIHSERHKGPHGRLKSRSGSKSQRDIDLHYIGEDLLAHECRGVCGIVSSVKRTKKPRVNSVESTETHKRRGVHHRPNVGIELAMKESPSLSDGFSDEFAIMPQQETSTKKSPDLDSCNTRTLCVSSADAMDTCDLNTPDDSESAEGTPESVEITSAPEANHNAHDYTQLMGGDHAFIHPVGEFCQPFNVDCNFTVREAVVPWIPLEQWKSVANTENLRSSASDTECETDTDSSALCLVDIDTDDEEQLEKNGAPTTSLPPQCSGETIAHADGTCEQLDPSSLQHDALLFIKQLPPHATLPVRPTLLPPPSSKRPTLVLDLDETLVHCSQQPPLHSDWVFDVPGCGIIYGIQRPHLEEFLIVVAAFYEVVVFTASQRDYANLILDTIDPQGAYFSHRIFRDSCLFIGDNYVKDLSILGRDLAQVIIVDNSIYVFGYQVDNGIPIESFEGSTEDSELMKLLPLLCRLSSVEDVRPLIRLTYQTYKRVEEAS
ncbi:nuclear lim interactor-interacting protein [Pelomyxa schiedti]|nr:nuclear lim interactor-interacting protein [Pelomyxa schiedti]